MRVKSEIWVHSYLRILFARGLAGYVVARGDNDAGAIFIRINRLDGNSRVFGPAPAGLDELDGGRGWMPLMEGAWHADVAIDSYLDEEKGMDPDIWILEVEDRQGRHLLDDWLISKE